MLDNNQLSGSIPSSLGDLLSLTSLRLNDNQLSGSIPLSWDSLSSLSLENNQFSGAIPEEWKSIANLDTLTLADNRFLPDDMASFIGGYGIDSNGWTAGQTFTTLSVSPQIPAHPSGDTVYFFASNLYIDGLTYSGTAYTGLYEFNPSTDTVMVRDSSRLSAPIEDSYSLKTTLTNSNYISPADTLIFTADITAETMLGLDMDNKPIGVAECALYAAGDDRGPLCYQYLAFTNFVALTLMSWDFSQAVTDSWEWDNG